MSKKGPADPSSWYSSYWWPLPRIVAFRAHVACQTWNLSPSLYQTVLFFFLITVWQILGCYGTEIQAFPPFKCNVKQYSDIYLPSFLPLLQDRVLSMSAIQNVPTLKPALLTGHLGLGGEEWFCLQPIGTPLLTDCILVLISYLVQNCGSMVTSSHNSCSPLGPSKICLF